MRRRCAGFAVHDEDGTDVDWTRDWSDPYRFFVDALDEPLFFFGTEVVIVWCTTLHLLRYLLYPFLGESFQSRFGGLRKVGIWGYIGG